MILKESNSIHNFKIELNPELWTSQGFGVRFITIGKPFIIKLAKADWRYITGNKGKR